MSASYKALSAVEQITVFLFADDFKDKFGCDPIYYLRQQSIKEQIAKVIDKEMREEKK